MKPETWHWSILRMKKLGMAILILVLLAGYWLLPISGWVIVLPGEQTPALLWPQMRLEPPSPGPGQKVTLQVTDLIPWANVLLTANGQPVKLAAWRENPGATWTWQWSFTPLSAGETILVFYHDCHTGCQERGRLVLGRHTPTASRAASLPTKLGVAFANPERDWHGRAGWDVEMTYARLADESYWGIDDLATRVDRAAAKGLRVLVRVDHERNQSLPPANDFLALNDYLAYLQRLARDDRLRGVYGYIIGSGFNASESNALAPARPVTPAWYARLFNGYGETVTRSDNAVQTIRRVNPQARVLVGPVRPWNRDQDGDRHYTIAVPWLNYMNSLVAALDEGAQAKAAAGIPLAAPDGFALHVPGRPGAPEMAGRPAATEPHWDLRRSEWNGAQAGFRLYLDWLAIINAYPTTRGLPAYISSTNTFAPDEGTPPAQNYPPGWLTTALDVVNREPQIQALCWFLDGPLGDTQWDWFSLSKHPGRMIDAAEEFDALLK